MSRDWYRNPRYEREASPASIRFHLAAERLAAAKSARRYAERIAWLERLLKRREFEQQIGEWPPRLDGDQTGRRS